MDKEAHNKNLNDRAALIVKINFNEFKIYFLRDIYRPLVEISHLGCAKAPLLRDQKQVNIRNMNLFLISQQWGFGAAQMGNFN